MTSAYLLDTNVLSELMRENPSSKVMAWFAQLPQAAMRTSAITQAEILTGVALLPAGKRRDGLAQAAEEMFASEWSGRCLPFDAAAAAHCAMVRAQRVRSGRPITTEDAQIAAIALANRLPLVTRNTKDFEGIDHLTVINPWDVKPSGP
ncbi:predicted nucleic acid-binding protein, contains PIN domain [Serpentinimonas raichei]|uniref:Ribonuclease VapC n=1 Tax=Serpentinimonas raichei TaxID=1458425 RepID=A0A060NH38_9BURK|nr:MULTISPECIES: type II toxin-antitoxin system VapC family toxin [Serpentinimonas]MBS3947103.1 type II toxin-antitoxin system VapC family toxin [Dethiobacter sp.]MDO8275762.1 type II toxin-antitoxin system VapC family toxin [Serpentinimonas sp.]MDO9612626.1 type II toxin-antitoxin system VapC family toxin [Serpentinimonas sp.]BAO79985.1 predicted nucleic acid-binding protein, contains PIN domain [Serpentinimonas raichei]